MSRARGAHTEPKAAFAPFSDRYRIVAFDARGSGDSEGKPPYTREQWAADVDGLRAWIGAEKIVMAGGSYGGFIALEYATRYPDRVSALVLRDTSADNSHRTASRENALASARIDVDIELFDRMMADKVRDNEDFKRGWEHILPRYDHDLDMEVVRDRVEQTPYRYETHNYAIAVNQADYDIKHKLPDIKVPTLLKVGRHGWITPVAARETIPELVPNSELVILEKSGHSPQLEEPEKFQGTVRGFRNRALVG